jgi:hypothetical protein
MSLSPQTIRLRHRLRQWQKSGRKHWDLYRYLYNPFLIHDALRLVLKNAGSGGLDGVRVQDIRGEEWDYVKRIIERDSSGADTLHLRLSECTSQRAMGVSDPWEFQTLWTGLCKGP